MYRLTKIALFLALLAAVAMPAQAASLAWDAIAGDFAVGANWTPDVTALSAGDVLTIAQGDTNFPTLSTDLSATVLGNINISAAGTPIGSFKGRLDVAVGGKLSAGNIQLGNENQNPGTMNVSGDVTAGYLTLGYTATTTSTNNSGNSYYTQNAGTSYFANDVRITTRRGYGHLVINGGTFTTPANIVLVYSGTGSSPAYMEVNGGTANCYDLRVGVHASGRGYYSQTNGTVNVSHYFYVGYTSPGYASDFSMSGGEINTGRFYTGYGATAAQSAGTINATSYMILGRNDAIFASAPECKYEMTGGTINAYRLRIGEGDSDAGGEIGTLNMTGNSVVNVEADSYLGLRGARGNLNMSATGDTSPHLTFDGAYLGFGYGNDNNTINPTATGSAYVDMGGHSVIDMIDCEVHVGIWERSYGEIKMHGDAVLNMSGNFLMFGDDWLRNAASTTNDSVGVLFMDDRAAVNLTGGASLYLGNLAYGKGTVNMGQVGDANDNPTLTVTGGYIYLGTGGQATFNQNAGTTSTTGGTQFNWTDTSIATNGGTLNLNGGTFITPFINTGDISAIGTVNFNGGVLKANTNSLEFISDSIGGTLNAYVLAGGATIDTNSFGVKISKPLQTDLVSLGGGLTKLGGGVLVLDDVNTYTGPTTISAGTLALIGTVASSSGITVAGGANLEFPVMGNSIPALTMNNGSKLSFSLTTPGTLLTVAGALSDTGTETIALNPVGGLTFDTSGPYVINADSVTAAGLTAASNVRAYNAVASVVGNTVQILLSSSGNSAKSLTYVAGAPEVWDINTTAHWTDGSNPEKFFQGDSVTFAAGMGNINIPVDGVVMPAAITANPGAGETYTLSGGGSISYATGGLTKNGDGTLVLDTGGAMTNGNDFIGQVNVTAGILKIGSNAISPLGSATYSTVVGAGAALDVNGESLGDETVEIQGDGVGGNGVIISTAAADQYYALKNVVVTGGANVTFGGTGRWDIRNGSLTAYGAYNLIKKGTNAIDICDSVVDNNLDDIDIQAGILYFEGTSTLGNPTKTITVAAAGTFDLYYTTSALEKKIVVNGGKMVSNGPNTLNGSIEMFTGSTFTADNAFTMANAAGTTASIKLHGDAQFTMNWGWIGGQGTGSTATIELNDTSILKANAWANIGEHDATANVYLHNTATLTAVDHFDFGYGANTNSTAVADGSSTIHSDLNLFIGVYGANARGKVQMKDTSTFTATQDVYVGRDNYDTTNLTAGMGTLELNNQSTAVVGRDVIVAYGYLTQGTLDLKDDTVTTITRELRIGRWGGDGILNVSGNAHVTAATIEVGHNWGNTENELGNATATVSGAGAVVSATSYLVLGGDAGKGTWTQAAGQTTAGTGNAATGGVVLGQGDYSDSLASYPPSYSIAVLNLNGGALTTPQVVTNAKVISTHADDLGATRINPVTATVNFNGGILQASATNANFIAIDDPAATLTLKVQAGGAVIDSNGFDIGSSLALVHDGVGTDGGLKKLGAGTLSLTGALSYNGNTTVNQGALAVTALNTPAAAVYVANAGTLNAGSIVANSLTVGGPPLAATAAVPEPGALMLLALAGLGALLAWRRK
ncbi:MAG: autotransporter-associated beta strand repeat-containing protein [Pirellulales bacterium]|nr:autotransporter-associated beta strand repeat-containing protein [Pirellulales bacterium]